MVWDIERGQSNVIEPDPWQSDTCIGGCTTTAASSNRTTTRTVPTVIHTLADVVSKNGNPPAQHPGARATARSTTTSSPWSRASPRGWT